MEVYCFPAAAASRGVLLTCKAVGVDPKVKVLDLFKKEHLRSDFVKINPQHTVPTLVDNGFALWESRAIMIYLAEKYAKDDTLYPKDPKAKAVVNQRLYFDMGTLYDKQSIFFKAVMAKESEEKIAETKKGMEGAVELLNIFLEGNDYVAGNHLTLADLSIVASISTYELIGIDVNKFSNVAKWYAKCQQEVPGYEVNLEGLEMFKNLMASMK